MLSLQQLCAGSLIDYPVYVSRCSGCYATHERVIQELQEWKILGPSTMPLWRRGLRVILGVDKN